MPATTRLTYDKFDRDHVPGLYHGVALLALQQRVRKSNLEKNAKSGYRKGRNALQAMIIVAADTC